MVSGAINRCAADGHQSAEFQTPKEMGITKSATIQMAITGVTLQYGNEAIENRTTEWKLTDPPSVSVADKDNLDPSKNVLTIGWNGDFLNVISYQLHYTIFLVQK